MARARESRGGRALDLDGAQISVLSQISVALIGLGVVICALSACVLRFFPRLSLRPWSIATHALSLCAFAVLAAQLSEPPTIMWDAVDEAGRPVFDTVIASPAAGSLLWLGGIASLLAAGVCGLLGEHRRARA